MLMREATSETYGPRVYLHHINLPILSHFLCFFTLILFYFASLSQKYQKYYLIISIRSHSRKWSSRDWQPLITLVARIYLFCAGTRDSRVASYWIDTLVLKNWGKYLRYFAASSLPLRGNPTQCSRGSKKNFWRHCRGVCAKVNIPSTHHNPYSPHYIICHLPLVFLSPTSPLPFYFPSLSLSSLSFSIFLFLPACFLFACVLVCFACRYG